MLYVCSATHTTCKPCKHKKSRGPMMTPLWPVLASAVIHPLPPHTVQCTACALSLPLSSYPSDRAPGGTTLLSKRIFIQTTLPLHSPFLLVTTPISTLTQTRTYYIPSLLILSPFPLSSAWRICQSRAFPYSLQWAIWQISHAIWDLNFSQRSYDIKIWTFSM